MKPKAKRSDPHAVISTLFASCQMSNLSNIKLLPIPPKWPQAMSYLAWNAISIWANFLSDEEGGSWLWGPTGLLLFPSGGRTTQNLLLLNNTSSKHLHAQQGSGWWTCSTVVTQYRPPPQNRLGWLQSTRLTLCSQWEDDMVPHSKHLHGPDCTLQEGQDWWTC